MYIFSQVNKYIRSHINTGVDLIFKFTSFMYLVVLCGVAEFSNRFEYKTKPNLYSISYGIISELSRCIFFSWKYFISFFLLETWNRVLNFFINKNLVLKFTGLVCRCIDVCYCVIIIFNYADNMRKCTFFGYCILLIFLNIYFCRWWYLNMQIFC